MVNTILTTTNNTVTTKEASLDEKLTASHTDHGPRVPCRNVRIEG